ncbi:MAG: hypothetical protein ACLP7O_11945 [Terracidiphilus sp.]
MSAKIQRLADIDRIIHEPARLMIVALLAAELRRPISKTCVK